MEEAQKQFAETVAPLLIRQHSLDPTGPWLFGRRRRGPHRGGLRPGGSLATRGSRAGSRTFRAPRAAPSSSDGAKPPVPEKASPALLCSLSPSLLGLRGLTRRAARARRQYQNHNPMPGPVYAGGGGGDYTCRRRRRQALPRRGRRDGSTLGKLLARTTSLFNDVEHRRRTPRGTCGIRRDGAAARHTHARRRHRSRRHLRLHAAAPTWPPISSFWG